MKIGAAKKGAEISVGKLGVGASPFAAPVQSARARSPGIMTTLSAQMPLNAALPPHKGPGSPHGHETTTKKHETGKG